MSDLWGMRHHIYRKDKIIESGKEVEGPLAPQENIDRSRHREDLVAILSKFEGKIHRLGEAILEFDKIRNNISELGLQGVENLLVLSRRLSEREEVGKESSTPSDVRNK